MIGMLWMLYYPSTGSTFNTKNHANARQKERLKNPFCSIMIPLYYFVNKGQADRLTPKVTHPEKSLTPVSLTLVLECEVIS